MSNIDPHGVSRGICKICMEDDEPCIGYIRSYSGLCGNCGCPALKHTRMTEFPVTSEDSRIVKSPMDIATIVGPASSTNISVPSNSSCGELGKSAQLNSVEGSKTMDTARVSCQASSDNVLVASDSSHCELRMENNPTAIEAEEINPTQQLINPSFTKSTIERPALGIVSKLGALYDTRTDQFIESFVITPNPPETMVNVTDNHSTDGKLIVVNNVSDRLAAVDMAPEMKLRILTGFTTLRGSGEYFMDTKQSARAVQVTFVGNITTIVEQLNILSGELKNYTAMHTLKNNRATHVVVGIKWGATIMITAEHENKENLDRNKITNALKAVLSNVTQSFCSTNDQPSVDYNNEDVSNVGLTFNIKSDVLKQHKSFQTIQEVKEMMNSFPKIVRQTSNGKGQPLHYILLPIKIMKSRFELEAGPEICPKKISDESVFQIVRLFDVITEVKQHLNNLQDDITQYEQYLPDKFWKALEEFKQKGTNENNLFQKRLHDLLVEIWAETTDSKALHDLLEAYKRQKYSAFNVNNFISTYFSDLPLMITNYQLFQKHGVYLIAKNETCIEMVLKQFQLTETYVLFYETGSQSTNTQMWETTLSFFLNLIDETRRMGNDIHFLCVDLEAAPHLTPTTKQKIVIQHFKNEECKSSNVYAEFAVDYGKCFIQSSSITSGKLNHRKRANLELICPGYLRQNCGNTKHKWRCFKCKSEVEYGFDEFFYCVCGKGRIETYSYRCNSLNHEFQLFPSEYLRQHLSELKPAEQVNILVLGETGVGKSTWINGILNYLTFKTLDEAVEEEGILHAIPMSFTTMDENYKQVRITVGQDDNENNDSTSSATQYPKTYTCRKDNKMFCFIDTPGIGDTKGIEQDKINFDRILSHLTYFDKINGICILLKPNEARLTVTLRFCVIKLLTHLHCDASENIVFCFTNARATLYRPGKTVISLSKLLQGLKDKSGVDIPIKRDTLYPMDNEAIRFLAAVKNGITFTDIEKANFAASWDTSVKETLRLFEYIENLPPHMTKDTLSLNEVRNMIVQLTKPLADISETIQANIRVLKAHERDLANFDITEADLENKLKIPVVRLEMTELGFPRTVCASSKCVKRVLGFQNEYHNVYSQICHDHCYLSGVSKGTTNETELQKCRAMSDEGSEAKCAKCGCSWFDHMHQTFSVEMVDDFEENKGIKDQLNNAKNKKAAKEMCMAKVDGNIKQFEKEAAQITRITAKFAVFLKRNAMSPYNDATAAFFDHLISLEQNISDCGASNKKLEALKRRKRAYEKEKKILEDRLKGSCQGDEEISPQNIQKVIDYLCSLPKTGPMVKQVIQNVNNGNKKMSVHSEVSFDEIKAKANTKPKQELAKKDGKWSLRPPSLWISKKF